MASLMTLAATRFETERFVERIDYIRSGITQIESDIRRVERKVDAVKDSIDALRSEMNHRSFFTGLDVDLLMFRILQLLIIVALFVAFLHGADDPKASRAAVLTNSSL